MRIQIILLLSCILLKAYCDGYQDLAQSVGIKKKTTVQVKSRSIQFQSAQGYQYGNGYQGEEGEEEEECSCRELYNYCMKDKKCKSIVLFCMNTGNVLKCLCRQRYTAILANCFKGCTNQSQNC